MGIHGLGYLGRHKNDQMLSFHTRSPAGCDVEIGTGGLLCGEDWLAVEFCESDVGGHEDLTAEAIVESTRNGTAGQNAASARKDAA